MSTAWFSQVGVMLLGFITLPVLLNGLGTREYAIYAVLLSLNNWFAISDLGLGFSLQNFISERKALSQSYNEFICAAAIVCLAVTLAFSVFAFAAAPWIARNLFANFQTFSASLACLAVILVGVTGILSTVTSNAFRIIHAEGFGWVGASFGIPFALLNLAGYLAAERFAPSSYKIHWFLLASILPQILIRTGGWVWVLQRISLKETWPKVPGALRMLLNRSKGFAFASLAGMLTLQIDYFALAHFRANDYVSITCYNLLNKFLGLILVFYSTLLFSLWPVFSERLALGKWVEAKRMMNKYILIGAGMVMLGSLSFLFFQDLIYRSLHIKEALHIDCKLIMLFSVYLLIRIWTDTHATILQSNNHLKIFLKVIPMQAVISIIGMIFLVPLYGVYGVIFSMILSFVFTVSWMLPRKLYLLTHKKTK